MAARAYLVSEVFLGGRICGRAYLCLSMENLQACFMDLSGFVIFWGPIYGEAYLRGALSRIFTVFNIFAILQCSNKCI